MIETDIKQQLITAEIEIDANIVVGSIPATPGITCFCYKYS